MDPEAKEVSVILFQLFKQMIVKITNNFLDKVLNKSVKLAQLRKS